MNNIKHSKESNKDCSKKVAGGAKVTKAVRSLL